MLPPDIGMTEQERRISTRSVILGARLRDGDEGAIEFIERSVKDAGGVVKEACREMGIPHRTFQNWRNDIPVVAQAVARGRDEIDIDDPPQYPRYEPDPDRKITDVCEGQARYVVDSHGGEYRILKVDGDKVTVSYEGEEQTWEINDVKADPLVTQS